MKSLFLATAAVAAFAAAPAFAQNVGSVGVTYSDSTFTDTDGDELSGDAWALDGVVAIPAFTGWTATLAGQIADNEGDTAGSAAAHLTTMAGSDLRVGGFVDVATDGDDSIYSVGAEVQKYLANATLTGSLAYTTPEGGDLDAWTVGADAAVYVLPNLRLNAGLAWSTLDNGDDSADAWSYGVGAEYEIASTPFSVAAGYTRTELEDFVDVDTWNIGLRYSFGGGLQARDRAGANLTGAGIASVLGAL